MTTPKATLPNEIDQLEDSDPLQVLRLSSAPIAVRYLAAVVMTAFATVIAVGLDSKVTIPNLSLGLCHTRRRRCRRFRIGTVALLGILGALAYNFFFTEPRYSLMVDDPANVWAIGLLFVVGCIASGVASIARRRADDAALLMRQATVLQLYSHDVVGADDAREIVSLAATTLEALFHVPVVVMLMSENVVTFTEKRGEIELLDVEMEAARSSLTTGRLSPCRDLPVRHLALRLLARVDACGTVGRHWVGVRPR